MRLLVSALPVLLLLTAVLTRTLLRRRRRDELRAFAQQFGLQYAFVDLLGLVDHSFDLFNVADAARTENVVWGRWHGVEVRAGELWFASKRRGPGQALAGLGERFTFAVVEVDAWLPHLKIERDSLASVSDGLGLERIRMESDMFNRTFRVTCEDEEFAFNFLDTRMMLWLLDVARQFPVEFEVKGRKMLLFMPRRRPGAMAPLFGLAKGFHDHVPRMVLREFALSAG